MIKIVPSGDYVQVKYIDAITGTESVQEELKSDSDAIEYSSSSNGKIYLKFGRMTFEYTDPTIFEIDGSAVTDAADFISKLTALFSSSSPGGGGVQLESYQNSAMSAAVMAYVFRDENDNIFRVYEPIRNNDVSRSQFAYADSIDKFRFDSTDIIGNTIDNVKLIDINSDLKLKYCQLKNMVIDGNNQTGMNIQQVVWTGKNGAVSPNNAELYVVGVNATIFYSTLGVGSYIDSIGGDFTCFYLFSSTDMRCRVNSKTDCEIAVATLAGQATIEFLEDGGRVLDSLIGDSGFLSVGDGDHDTIELGEAAGIGAYTYGKAFKSVGNVKVAAFGVIKPATHNDLNISLLTIGENLRFTTSSDMSNTSLEKLFSKDHYPTLSEIPTNSFSILKNTANGDVVLWANDDGVMKYALLTAITQLDIPANFGVTIISDTEIDLGWDVSANATNYIVERGLLADYSDVIQIYSGASNSLSDTGLTPATTYYYRVKAQGSVYTDSDWATIDGTTNP